MRVPDAVTAEVRALASLGLQELREEWRRRWGPPPKLRSPDFLRRLLAYRIQAAVAGGLDPETKRRLRSMAELKPALSVGARLSREWGGRLHEAEVLAAGKLLYEGRVFSSPSALATHIAGSRWNGHRFFGLRSEAKV